jgi:hypothetical protein
MNCKEFEQEWVSLEDSGLTPAMEAHRQLCRSCSEMVEDLNYIVQQAREVRMSDDAADEPPERLWPQIQRRLEQENLIHEPRHGLRPGRLSGSATGWLMRLPMGLAYAAVFFVAVGVMYVHSLLQVPAAPPMLAAVPEVPAGALEQIASAASDEDVTELAQRVPPEHREVFVSSWNQVNSSIRQMNDFLQEHPEDPFVPMQLRDAIHQREHLRETLVRWEQF